MHKPRKAHSLFYHLTQSSYDMTAHELPSLFYNSLSLSHTHTHTSNKNICSQVCAAMVYISQNHVRHSLSLSKVFAYEFDTQRAKIHVKLLDVALNSSGDGSCGDHVRWTAPEVLMNRKKHSEKSDVWSLGVMSHLLLTGRYPFTDSDSPYTPKLQKVFDNILNAPLEQNRDSYKRLTPCAKDFLSRTLEKNVDLRMGVAEALEHPFLRL